MAARANEIAHESTIDHYQTLMDVAWNFDYEAGVPKVEDLYRRAKDNQWNADHLKWDTMIDPANPIIAADHSMYYRMPFFKKLSKVQQETFGAHSTAQLLSQFLHGEQGALLTAATIAHGVPDVKAKYYAAHASDGRGASRRSVRTLREEDRNRLSDDAVVEAVDRRDAENAELHESHDRHEHDRRGPRARRVQQHVQADRRAVAEIDHVQCDARRIAACIVRPHLPDAVDRANAPRRTRRSGAVRVRRGDDSREGSDRGRSRFPEGARRVRHRRAGLRQRHGGGECARNYARLAARPDPLAEGPDDAGADPCGARHQAYEGAVRSGRRAGRAPIRRF